MVRHDDPRDQDDGRDQHRYARAQEVHQLHNAGQMNFNIIEENVMNERKLINFYGFDDFNANI